jgi:hypothetical protein
MNAGVQTRLAAFAAWAVGLLALSTVAVAMPTPACQPKFNEIAVFAEPNYQGACAVHKGGRYLNANAIGLGGKPIRSILLPDSDPKAMLCGVGRVGRDVRVNCEFFESSKRDVRFDGRSPFTYLDVARWQPFSDECEAQYDEVVLLRKHFGSHEADLAFWMCRKLKPGDYPSPESLGLIDPEQGDGRERDAMLKRMREEGQLLMPSNVEQVLLGSPVRARVCEGADFTGRCAYMVGGSGYGYLMKPRDAQAAWPKRVGSAQIYANCSLWPEAALVFEDDDMQGRCTELRLGRHDNMAALKLQGRAARALRVGSALQVTICSEEALQGRCREVAGGHRIKGLDIRSLEIRSAPATSASAASR